MELGAAARDGAERGGAVRAVDPRDGGRDEIAILSSDPVLIEALRGAAPEVLLVAAGSVGELARLLGTHPCRALAVDFSNVGTGGPELLDRLAALFPELPLIAIGAPSDQGLAAALIARGIVYRWLGKPVARERARATLTEAARHGHERRFGVAPTVGDAREAPGVAPRTSAAPPASEAASRERSDVPARTDPPAPTPRAPARSGAGAALRRLSLLALVAVVVGVAVYAVRQRVQTARDAAPPAVATAPTKATAPPDAPAPPNPEVSTLLAAGDLALSRGALLEPMGASALDYYRRALALDPQSTAARTGLAATAEALLRDAGIAFAARRYAEAEAAVHAAALARPDDSRGPALLARIRSARSGDRRLAARAATTAAAAAGSTGRETAAAATGSPGGAAEPAAATSTTAPSTAIAAPAARTTEALAAGAEPRAAATGAVSTTPAPGAGPAVGNAAARGERADRRAIPDEPALVRVAGDAPEFPLSARAEGRSGWVDVRFLIGVDGVPRDVRVAQAEPSGVFDRAARRAVETWRYQPLPEPRRVQVRLRFRLEE